MKKTNNNVRNCKIITQKSSSETFQSTQHKMTYGNISENMEKSNLPK